MGTRKFDIKRATRGQEKAHVSMAATNILRAVRGDIAKITRKMVENEAAKSNVPLEAVLTALRSKGVNV
jgi:hypothetical protein